MSTNTCIISVGVMLWGKKANVLLVHKKCMGSMQYFNINYVMACSVHIRGDQK